MNEKTITFEYDGGEYVQNINIKGPNFPWRYECDAEWLDITAGATSLKLVTGVLYDYHDRYCVVRLFDKYNNELDISVVQKGYRNLSVECGSNAVFYKSYFDLNNFFNFYITVYGGPTQEVICPELEGSIVRAFDNSDMYNDYILRIDNTFKGGTFVIEHSDCKGFVEYCEAYGIPYDISKLRRAINVVTMDSDDIVGYMELQYGKKVMTNRDENVQIKVNSKKWTAIRINKCEYSHIDSPSHYSVITDTDVDVTGGSWWLNVKNDSDGYIRIKPDSNPFECRSCVIRVINHTNSHQYINITIIQEQN